MKLYVSAQIVSYLIDREVLNKIYQSSVVSLDEILQLTNGFKVYSLHFLNVLLRR